MGRAALPFVASDLISHGCHHPRKRMIQYAALSRRSQIFRNTGCPAFAGHDGGYFSAESKAPCAYFTAPKRLSTEFDDTIGADPATGLGAAGAGAAACAGASET